VRWAEEGRIRCLRPGGTGGRRYDISSVLPEVRPQASLTEDKIDAVYARVSTRRQQKYLENQVSDLLNKYPNHTVFTDVCSGINFKRKGLKTLLELAFAGRLRVVRIAHRDRLCRFAYDLLEWLFEKHGAKIIVEAHHVDAPERELADDVISIITVFGARLYGSRSKRGKRSREEEKDGSGAGELQVKESAGGEPGVSDFLGEDVSDCSAGGGASPLLCSGEMVV